MILRLEYGRFKLLFGGDLNQPAEDFLLRSGDFVGEGVEGEVGLAENAGGLLKGGDAGILGVERTAAEHVAVALLEVALMRALGLRGAEVYCLRQRFCPSVIRWTEYFKASGSNSSPRYRSQKAS